MPCETPISAIPPAFSRRDRPAIDEILRPLEGTQEGLPSDHRLISEAAAGNQPRWLRSTYTVTG